MALRRRYWQANAASGEDRDSSGLYREWEGEEVGWYELVKSSIYLPLMMYGGAVVVIALTLLCGTLPKRRIYGNFPAHAIDSVPFLRYNNRGHSTHCRPYIRSLTLIFPKKTVTSHR